MKLSCHHAARLLSEKRDRRLPWRVRIVLRIHMLKCKMCQVYGAQLNVVNSVCNEASARAAHELPVTMSEERKRRMREMLGRGNADP
jgi:hypothetical protein